MSTRRHASLALVSSLLLAPRVHAQQRKPQLGWLLGSSPRSASFNASFERALSALGYIDGKTLLINDLFANGVNERFLPLARELVSRNPDVLFVSGPEATLKAVSQATDRIPIVVCAVDFDPEARGYVRSLARPGANITGLHLQQIEATAKRLELLRQLLPSVRRVAAIADLFTTDQVEIARTSARALGLELVVVELHDYPYDYALLLKQLRESRAEAALVLMSPRMFPGRETLVTELRKQRMPAVFGLTQYVDVGGLASYGASLEAMFARAAYFVDKIIKGESPSTIPMEQPTVFDLAVNVKAAKALGISVSDSILLRATRIVQ